MNLDQAGRMIASELERSGIDLGKIAVRDAGLFHESNILLVRPSTWPVWMEHRPDVCREEMTPTTAMQIANYLTVHNGHIDEIRQQYETINRQLSALQGMPADAEIVLFRSDNVLSSNNATTYTLHATLHENNLVQVRKRITMRAESAERVLSAVANDETRRQGLILEAGGRLEAMRCCSVTAAVARKDPDAWITRIHELLHISDNETVRDGVWTPRVNVAKGVQWRRDTLILHGDLAGGLPHTIRSAIKGKPLKTIIEHPLLPEAAVITAINQRRNEEVYVHTGPQLNRESMTSDIIHTEALLPLLEELEIDLG